MDSETRRAIQALCEKLGHQYEEYRPTTMFKPAHKLYLCKICDKVWKNTQNKIK